MKRVGTKGCQGTLPLQAVVGFVFLLLTALQPGLFATANAMNLHDGASMMHGAGEPAVESDSHDHGDEDGASASQVSLKFDHGKAKKSGDKSCEVHCAPAQAVPVELPLFAQLWPHGFMPGSVAALALHDYAELIRPPRRMR